MAGRIEHVVIDANVAVALSIVLPWSSQARCRVAGWQETRTGILAPTLWQYEVVSALRKAWQAGLLTPDEAGHALTSLFSLGVQFVEPDLELHRAALRWASRLGQAVAYDAQYLALAERIGATLWTADRRLFDRARECGAKCVQLISEP